MTIEIGSTVWVFDRNHRVYKRDPSGNAIGRPIYREYFRPYTIVSETARSWVLENGLKVPKTGEDVRDAGGGPYGKTRVFMTEKAKEDTIWRERHAWTLGDAVRACNDSDVLRQVAKLIGYDPEKQS